MLITGWKFSPAIDFRRSASFQNVLAEALSRKTVYLP
jgi:hypothetical protein